MIWLLSLLLLIVELRQSNAQEINLLILDGDSLNLECKLPDHHDRVMWVFVDHSGVEQVIYNMEEFREEYSFNCSMKGHCSMELKSVSRANAGKYFCKANTLTSPFTLVVEYNVNVGRLSCHSNIGSNLEAIAVSDCKRVKATNLRQTCTLEYHGSWSNIPVRWRRRWKNGTYVNQNHSNQDKKGNPVAGRNITVEFQEEVTAEMVDQSFECSVQDQRILPCTLKLSTISYARNRSKKLPLMSDPQKPKKCEADTNEGLQCSYAWFIPNTDEKIENQELLPKDIKEQGVYRCIATCTIGEISDCKVLADEFELAASSNSSKMPIIIPIVVALCLLFLVVLPVVGIILFKRRKAAAKKKKDVGNKELKDVVTSNEPLLSGTAQNHPAATPIPISGHSTDKPSLSGQSHNGGGVSTSGRKVPFKRGTSGKGSLDFQTIQEEGDKNQVAQIGQKILLNDARGPVMGVGHLGDRIYCVTKGSNKLFMFIDSPPYNRMIPEEVIVGELTNPQALVVCPDSKSLYISDYSEKNIVYRIFPMVKEGNKVSRGRLDGNPAGIALVHSKPNTIVVILKRDKKMHIEIYDSSASKDSRGSVNELETWEKKYIITTNKDVVLPLCVTTVRIRDDASSSSSCSERLYLLYGSGKYLSTGGEFESYKVSQINLETSLVYNIYDLKDLSQGNGDKFVTNNMTCDESQGGILILGKKGQLVHLNPDLTLFNVEAKLGSSHHCFCFRPKERIVILGSSNKSFLVCYKLKDVSPRC